MSVRFHFWSISLTLLHTLPQLPCRTQYPDHPYSILLSPVSTLRAVSSFNSYQMQISDKGCAIIVLAPRLATNQSRVYRRSHYNSALGKSVGYLRETGHGILLGGTKITPEEHIGSPLALGFSIANSCRSTRRTLKSENRNRCLPDAWGMCRYQCLKNVSLSPLY